MFLKQGKIEQKSINVFFFDFDFQASLFRAILFKQGIPKLLFTLQTEMLRNQFFSVFKRFFIEILKTICFKKRSKSQFASQVWCGLHVSSQDS